jgi:16S rRNA (uracil1498-N3)-methyltransferase
MKQARVFARNLKVPPTPGELITLEPDQWHYLHRVLRIVAGDPIQISDGFGGRWQATLTTTPHTGALITSVVQASPSSAREVCLVQAISTAEKMDYTIEKAVELGVNRIVPVASQTSVVKLTSANAQRKQQHWHNIIEAACLQSGRDDLPSLDAPTQINAFLSADQHRQTLLGHARLVLQPASATGLARWVHDHKPAAMCLAIGPESGWSDRELALFESSGWLNVHLGGRVLRTETAGLAALAMIQAIASLG